MSAICGVFKLKGASPADGAVVEAMCNVLKHRGPDGHRLMRSEDGRVCMGYRWLKAGGPEEQMRQPAAAAGGKVLIAFEGALTEKIGREPNPAERIALSYVEHGENFLDVCQGEFGLALYDAEKRRLILARDRAGARALYYAVTEGAVYFSSEAAALLECPGVERVLNDEGVYHYFTFGACPPPYTLFKDVCKLRPAEMRTFDENGRQSGRAYWNMLSGSLLEGGEEEFIERTLELLRASTGELSSYSRAGAAVFLSGGLDSASMLACLAGGGGRVRTITLGSAGPDGKPMGEMDEARVVAERFGSEHHEVVIGRDELLGRFRRLMERTDDPYSASEAVLVDAIAEKASEIGAAVVLYGEAADVGFAEAGAAEAARGLEAEEKHLSRKSRLALRAGAFRRNVMPRLFGRFRSIDESGEMYARAARGRRLHWGWGIQIGEDFKRILMADDYLKRIEGVSSYDVVTEQYREMESARPGVTTLQKMSYLKYGLWTAEKWARSAVFPHGIDARLPFFDRRLTEFAMALPERALVGDGRGKYLLKRAMENILPDEIINREKVGFTSPVISWLSDALADMLEEEMKRSNELDGALFEFRVIHKLIKAHRAKKADNKWVLMQLVTFFAWYRRWIARRSV